MKAGDENQQKLTAGVKADIKKIEQYNKEKKGVLAQTIFLGTLGLIFIIPVIVGAYVGVWLDDKLKGFSISWTISLIFVGIIVGAMNVYFFLKE